MDGCGTDTETLRSKIEERQPYLLYVETADDAKKNEIADMLEVCKIQENRGGDFVWNFNQPVTILPRRGLDYQCWLPR